MRLSRIATLALFALAILAIPASATTLIRQGLETLSKDNEQIVQGRVIDIHSYWNDDHTFILTDVRVRPTRVLKGERGRGEITFTVLGGTVGEITTLVIASPDLVSGSDYLLFLNREDLPGASQRLTVRDLAQGAFDVANGRAYSQAAHHPLLADSEGRVDPPGGAEGLALDDMVRQIGRIVGER